MISKEFTGRITFWTFSGLFAFPILPLKVANILTILFFSLVFLELLKARFRGYGQSLRMAWWMALPFLPYLIEFLLFPSHPLARFAFEKKILLLAAPLVIPWFIRERFPERHRDFPVLVFSLSLACLALYAWIFLSFSGTLTDPEAYGNGAFLLRHRFEDLTRLHPTYFSLFSVVAVMLLLSGFQPSRMPLKILRMAGILLLVVSVLLLAARMPLLILCLCLILWIWKRKGDWMRKLLYTMLVPSLLGMSMVFIPSLKERTSEIHQEPWKKGVPDNTLTTRRIISDCAWEVFSQNLLTGTGSRNAQLQLDACYFWHVPSLTQLDTYNAHNQYLTIGIAYGLFFLLAFLFYLAMVSRYAGKHREGIYLVTALLLIFFTESILERQMGVYFMVLFTMYFLRKPESFRAV